MMSEDEARQFAVNEARKYGLEDEVRAAFDEHIKAGHEPGQAAWMALYDWDI